MLRLNMDIYSTLKKNQEVPIQNNWLGPKASQKMT